MDRNNTDTIITIFDDEIDNVIGGVGPVGGYAIAIGLGSLFLAAFSAGYTFGKDLAVSLNGQPEHTKNANVKPV